MPWLTSFILLCQLFSPSISETVTCGKGPCSCNNQNEDCYLECLTWQQCFVSGGNAILDCNTGYLCDVECGNQGGDTSSCQNAIINSNDATQLYVSCSEYNDCFGVTVNCGNATICDVNCHDPDDLGVSNVCKNLKLNCGTSACTITCNDQHETCGGIQVETSNAYSFQCIEINDGGCEDAPPPVLPPTIEPTLNPSHSPTTAYPSISPTTAQPSTSPTFDPTMEPTSYPSQDPTINPTINPTFDPTVYPTFTPTISYQVVSNITIEIIIIEDNANITKKNVEDIVDNTTRSYLNELFVNDDYKLTVDVIETDGDTLIVNIIVATNNGESVNSDDEQLLFTENEKELEGKYGDKVNIINRGSIVNDNNQNDTMYLIYILVAIIIVTSIFIIFLLWIFCRKRQKKSDKGIDDNVELHVPQVSVASTSAIDDNGEAQHDAAYDETNDGDVEANGNTVDSNNRESDTVENLYVDDDNDIHWTTKGEIPDDDDAEKIQNIQDTDSDNDKLYGSGHDIITKGADNNVATPQSENETNEMVTDDKENGSDTDDDNLYGNGNVITQNGQNGDD